MLHCEVNLHGSEALLDDVAPVAPEEQPLLGLRDLLSTEILDFVSGILPARNRKIFNLIESLKCWFADEGRVGRGRQRSRC